MTFTRHAVLVVPGRFDTRTGGYEYDRRIVEGVGALGWRVLVRELDGSFPRPTAAARRNAARVLAELPRDRIVVIDGLALGALPEELAKETARLRLIALVHHPLALETGLDQQTARELRDSERRALSAVRRVIVTSRATAAALTGYGVETGEMSVVEPGTDPSPLARGSPDGPVQMLCVGTLIPRKGHELLIRALARIDGRDWRLSCVGSATRDPVTSRGLRELLRTCALEAQITLEGEGDAAALARQYDRADLFVLPTLYEGYGMAVAEAIAHGLPVISTTTGAIADIVPGDGGVLVEPGDMSALTAALSAVLGSAPLRTRLAAGARRRRGSLPTWDTAAAKMAAVLEMVADG
jgi:glycosyltransferase involved in cell wall biosynthesis